MATKTIGLDEEAYEQLKAAKREGESFSDAVKRITDEVTSDWRHSIGKYSDEQAEAFESAVRESHDTTARGLAHRQHEATELLGEETEHGRETE